MHSACIQRKEERRGAFLIERPVIEEREFLRQTHPCSGEGKMVLCYKNVGLAFIIA
jgi:hypothetical protein